MALQNSATKYTIHIWKEGFPRWLTSVLPPQLNLSITTYATQKPHGNKVVQF